MSENDDNLQKDSPRWSWLRVVGIAVTAFILLAIIFIIVIPFLSLRPPHPISMICGTKLGAISKSMRIYVSDYNGLFPTGENWCDLLVMYADVPPKLFVCNKSDAVLGESSYAFNSNLLGKNWYELDGDIVLAFETNFGKGSPLVPVESRDYYKDHYKNFPSYSKGPPMVAGLRWNQVGGLEIATGDNHKGGCNVIFVDMHYEFVKTEDLASLNWGEPNESEQNK